jgi:hypothetical protein
MRVPFRVPNPCTRLTSPQGAKGADADPVRESKSRIKRLKGLRQPQYRLRVDEMRVFYDVDGVQRRVEVLGFVKKPQTFQWLQEHGVPE